MIHEYFTYGNYIKLRVVGLVLGSMHAFLQVVYKLEKSLFLIGFTFLGTCSWVTTDIFLFGLMRYTITSRTLHIIFFFRPLDIEAVGSAVPYYLFEPVLKRCTAAQLYRIEDFNPVCMCSTCTLYIYIDLA